MKTATGKTVTLRATAWEGYLPNPGDWLRTATGRQYEILEVKCGRNRVPFRMTCMVLPESAELTTEKLFIWSWNVRRKRSLVA